MFEQTTRCLEALIRIDGLARSDQRLELALANGDMWMTRIAVTDDDRVIAFAIEFPHVS